MGLDPGGEEEGGGGRFPRYSPTILTILSQRALFLSVKPRKKMGRYVAHFLRNLLVRSCWQKSEYHRDSTTRQFLSSSLRTSVFAPSFSGTRRT